MADEPQRFCLGIAYMPGKNPQITKGADGGRDYLTEAELEKAAWSYLRSGPHVNAFHVPGTEGCATVVESSIHRGPDWDLGDGIVVTKGTWLVGAILDAPMWQAALDGKVNGWSPEGTARRRKVRKEGVMPIAKSALSAEGDEEFTELVDADFPTMGLVGKGANGVPRWLVMKDADGEATGLLDPEFIRDLIAKAEPEPSGRERVEMPNGITLNGSPADIAAFIHKASVRQAEDGSVAKAKNDDTADRKHKAATGAAMPDGSYPIADEADLDKAIRAVGRGGSSHDAIRKHIITRARSLGASSKIPDNWNSDGSLKEKVAKDMADMGPELDDGIDGLDPTVPLCEPDEMGPGDPTDPGSPAWESIDAATAQKWLSIAARMKNALCVLAEREMLEAASADPDDAENAWDLEDAKCAVDYVISTLAVFAAGEQAEADLGGEAMEAIGKAMARFDPRPLATVEGLCAVAKSGRVLSAANEAHIRDAAAALNTVLSSLPKAPQATDDGQPVAKQEGTAMADTETATETSGTAAQVEKAAPSAEDQARDTGPVNAGGTTGMGEPRKTGPDGSLSADGSQTALPGDVPGRTVIKAAAVGVFGHGGRFLGLADSAAILTEVAKADGDGKKAMCVVYNQAGKLMGIVDPDDITPVANSEAEPDEAPDSDGGDAEPAADGGDMTPQPPADAGTPADTVQPDGTVTKQQDQDTGTRDVLKSIVKEALGELLGAQPPQEDIAKQADVAAAAARLDELAARLETVEKQDAAPRVFTNGAVPPDGVLPPPRPSLRGQDRGAPVIDVAKAREMKQRMYTADPAEANRIATELNQSAIATLEAIHAAGRQ